MDVETENIIKLINDGNRTDSTAENPDFTLYLAKLGTYGVDQLAKEPERLTEEKAALLEQTQNLVFTNYRTFIQTAECSREIFQQFNNVERKLDSLITKLPEFCQKCQHFSKTSNEINTHRRLNSLTLVRNAQLLEILELPQLMDTCIRNGNYEEALELASYVRRLDKRHSQIKIIRNIAQDIEEAWQVMLHQLLAQLRTDLQLPRCLQVVGYLRHMEVFSEAELRLKFLQARDTWLSNLLASISKENAGQHIIKTIELTRIHLFNIVTQYKAIFSDDDPILPSSKDQNINIYIIFYSWILEKISQFLATLEQDLCRGVGSSLDSIIEQCMYFGLSFSRVGVDFRALVAPIFVKTVVENFRQAVEKTTKKFEQDMENFILPKSSANMLKYASQPNQSFKPEHPPHSLLAFYPVAEFCNGILTAFNDLRLYAPIAASLQITDYLGKSLQRVSRTVLQYHRREHQAMTPAEHVVFSQLCQCIGLHLMPYLQVCLQALFPPQQIAVHLGIPLQQVLCQNVVTMDESTILQSIRHLLPKKTPAKLPLDNNVEVKLNKSEEKTNNENEQTINSNNKHSIDDNIQSSTS